MCLDFFLCVRFCYVFIVFYCNMLYYCNMVMLAPWDWELPGWLTTLLQCFDTAGWVIRPVKISSQKWCKMHRVGRQILLKSTQSWCGVEYQLWWYKIWLFFHRQIVMLITFTDMLFKFSYWRCKVHDMQSQDWVCWLQFLVFFIAVHCYIVKECKCGSMSGSAWKYGPMQPYVHCIGMWWNVYFWWNCITYTLP